MATLGPAERSFVVDLKGTLAEDTYWFTRTDRFAVSAIGESGRESELVESPPLKRYGDDDFVGFGRLSGSRSPLGAMRASRAMVPLSLCVCGGAWYTAVSRFGGGLGVLLCGVIGFPCHEVDANGSDRVLTLVVRSVFEPRRSQVREAAVCSWIGR